MNKDTFYDDGSLMATARVWDEALDILSKPKQEMHWCDCGNRKASALDRWCWLCYERNHNISGEERGE